MNHYLKDCLDESLSVINRCKSKINVGDKNCSFAIDCTKLPKMEEGSRGLPDQLITQFDRLKEIKGPCVYWFEIKTDMSRRKIINKLTAYTNCSNHRVVPYFKDENKDEINNILYVGKVKNNFYRRIVQHLGYYSCSTTQGLQLAHWAKELNLELELKFVCFDDDMAELVVIVKAYFARKCKPLLGMYSK